MHCSEKRGDTGELLWHGWGQETKEFLCGLIWQLGGRWPAFWMGWGRICQKVDLSRHQDASTNSPKALDGWGGGPGGKFLWENFAITGLRRALFLPSTGLDLRHKMWIFSHLGMCVSDPSAPGYGPSKGSWGTVPVQVAGVHAARTRRPMHPIPYLHIWEVLQTTETIS